MDGRSSPSTLYFNDDGLLGRHDNDIEISGGASAAHYVSDYEDVVGIKLDTDRQTLAVFHAAPGNGSGSGSGSIR